MAQFYPWSRISTRNCPVCRTQQGQLGVRPGVTVSTADGSGLDFVRVSCDGCGYTMLFDAGVMTTSPYQGGDEELPPKVGNL